MSEQIAQQARESAELYKKSGSMAFEALAEYHLGRMQLGEVAILLAEIAPLLQQIQSDIDSDLMTSRQIVSALDRIGLDTSQLTTGSKNPSAANINQSIAETKTSASNTNAHILQALLYAAQNNSQNFFAVSDKVSSLIEQLDPVADYLASARDHALAAAEASKSYGDEI